jgi:intein/homing endonuclease
MGLENRLSEFLHRHPEIKAHNGKFTVKKSEAIIKLPSKLNPELCRIVGIIHGDGNMSGRRLLITDQNREYHDFLHKLFARSFCLKLNLFHDNARNTFYSHSKNTIVYKFLTEVLEIPVGPVRPNLRIPQFIRKSSLRLQSEYIAGIFDSESHIRRRQAEIDFSTTSEELWEFVKCFLLKIGIKFSARIRKRRKNAEFEIFIYGKSNMIIFNKYAKLMHPIKKERIEFFLSVTKNPGSLSCKPCPLDIGNLKGVARVVGKPLNGPPGKYGRKAEIEEAA